MYNYLLKIQEFDPQRKTNAMFTFIQLVEMKFLIK